MADESSDAALARIDERTTHVLEHIALLRAEIAAIAARNDAALREHEGRMVQRIDNVHAHVTSEVLALRQDKEREHADIMRRVAAVEGELGEVREELTVIRSLRDQVRGARAVMKAVWLAGGAGLAGLVNYLFDLTW